MENAKQVIESDIGDHDDDLGVVEWIWVIECDCWCDTDDDSDDDDDSDSDSDDDDDDDDDDEWSCKTNFPYYSWTAHQELMDHGPFDAGTSCIISTVTECTDIQFKWRQ